jgi:ankyrin repeat protein
MRTVPTATAILGALITAAWYYLTFRLEGGPLVIAARTHHKQRAVELLASGASPTDEDRYHRSALEYAANWGDREVLKAMLAHLPTPPTEEQLENLLYRSAFAKEPGGFLELVERAQNVNCPDPTGATPLMITAQEGEPSRVKALLRRGADLHARDALGEGPIEYAIHRDNAPNLAYLLKSGVRLKNNTVDGKSPLALARECGALRCSKAIKDGECARPQLSSHQ